MKRFICWMFGHREGPWFVSLAGACSQHPFADGYQCYRCGRLLSVYDEDDDLLEAPDIEAPDPIDTWGMTRNRQ